MSNKEPMGFKKPGLSEAARSEAAEMITKAVSAALGNTEPQIVDLTQRVNNLTESLQEVVDANKRLQVEFENNRFEGGDDVTTPAMESGNTQLTGGCRCDFSAEYNRIICAHMKALHNALTMALLAGANVLPPDPSPTIAGTALAIN